MTFAGARFGTMQRRIAVGEQAPPDAASARRLLRGALPALYQDSDFTMRFVGALEQSLDPVVGLLDSLAAHFDAKTAPPDVLDLLIGWLGLEHDESSPATDRRGLVQNSTLLGRLRGTRAGLELALKLAFPDVPFRVKDPGRVAAAVDPSELPAAGGREVVVLCDAALPPERQLAVARVIERVKPLGVVYKLRVKAPKSAAKGNGADGDVS
jgi:phage tail-like protein